MSRSIRPPNVKSHLAVVSRRRHVSAAIVHPPAGCRRRLERSVDCSPATSGSSAFSPRQSSDSAGGSIAPPTPGSRSVRSTASSSRWPSGG
ncbi:hypothetical protein AArcMg_1404 [Natrarchaeobaculum sulfurireducens]|uniref:Uncharacterized protein n=1 Tax=Natrarchaeobaculum sulfurireducens TaxID=2044521 RepID=A0A346PG84_9EURY|nr:hypothetical protein AArc1_2213 [Natrarchaeobaculum sulfurireducens]AXR81419.1 hypothetical protein AArcMg_1404 [Natrarchaeobaculum sulfurireducens]